MNKVVQRYRADSILDRNRHPDNSLACMPRCCGVWVVAAKHPNYPLMAFCELRSNTKSVDF